MKIHPPPGTSGPPAFSLVEVLLAVGIAATLVTLLIGLLPAGLEDLRTSGNRMASARILQWVVNDLQMKDFSEWAAADEPLILHFDGSGDPMPTPEPAPATRRAIDSYPVFIAQISRLAEPGLTLPGAAAPNPNAVRARIRIGEAARPQPFAVPATYMERTVTVTRMEKP